MTDTTDQSSYVRYLPPVLWEGDNPLLKKLLLVFEKILTGVDDVLPIRHNDHEHEAIEVLISQLHQLFDPWQTPPQFLDWLASWVDLELPRVWDIQQHQYNPQWSEYQRRNAIAQIVPIYQQRGLKKGLDRFLKLSIPAEIQPRIAIDDGSRVLFMRPQPERFAQIATLLGQKPFLYKDASDHDAVLFEGPITPQGIALAPDGSLLLCDNGAPQKLTPDLTFGIGKGIWRVLPFGQNNPSKPGGQPQRIGPPFVDGQGHTIWSLSLPLAIAVDNLSPWHVYILSGGDTLYRITSSDFTGIEKSASKTTHASTWTINYPVAMLFDTTSSPTSGHLLILDRGLAPATAGDPSPKIIDMNIKTTPVRITTHPLTNVIQPLSLAILSNGDLIIGDAGNQDGTGPADLRRVVRSTTSLTWDTKPLLNSLPQNPLLAPVALVNTDDTHLFVLDLGLKPYDSALGSQTSKPFLRNLVRPAAVYRVDLDTPHTSLPQVTRASEEGQLVFPTAIVWDQQDILYIADQGEYSDPGGNEKPHVWRARAHEFGVAVYFSQQSTPQARGQIMQTVSEIITREKPAHTNWTTVYPFNEIVES